MQKLKNQNGFTAFDIIIVIVALVAIGAAGYFAYQARRNTNNDYSVVVPKKTATTTATSATTKPSSEFDIKEWSVKMTLPTGLSGLSYSLDSKTAVAIFVSAQLKGQPSSCTDQSVTDGVLATVTSSTTEPTSGFPGDPIPTNLERKVGSTYYLLSLPNGSSCQSSTSLKTTEADQTQLIQQAFQTLQAL
jgi:hypothetical protein